MCSLYSIIKDLNRVLKSYIHCCQSNLLLSSTDDTAGGNNGSRIDQDIRSSGIFHDQFSKFDSDGGDLGTTCCSCCSPRSPTCSQGLHHSLSFLHLISISSEGSNLFHKIVGVLGTGGDSVGGIIFILSTFREFVSAGFQSGCKLL